MSPRPLSLSRAQVGRASQLPDLVLSEIRAHDRQTAASTGLLMGFAF